ncbi:hypothetical protein HYH02_007387 [Chlamydomonas schloesseri]|uniref:Cyclin N-terminal domain-containing protein n=1 Tax=Chlamydomonas schloesseri TaxID=2026947 RepID=A0A835WIM3_9CHLO|nr:hypothetical protein HYH02_007387 [Chlamydomonas schloesseri]|eukprot:KAG2447934.1 hypothetical protein HYH02_007387 [Chlamydomonas schloesseri]
MTPQRLLSDTLDSLEETVDCATANSSRSTLVNPSSSTEVESSLQCDEDEHSLLPDDHLTGSGAHVPHAQVLGLPRHPFSAEDAQAIIKNELIRQAGLRYVPDRPEARRFASLDRPRIVSWLVEVVSALRLSDEALYAAVSLLDRFVAGTETFPPEHVLQLLALACISLASKHEEVAQYRADDWVRLAVDSANRPLYQREDLQRMEMLLLETVDWRIRVPNSLVFLRLYHNVLLHQEGVVPADAASMAAFKTCANFLAELSLLYDAFLPYGYSTVATACLVLAEWTIKGNAGPAAMPQTGGAPAIRTVAALTELAGVDVAALAPNLAPCVEALHQLYAQATAPGPDGAPPSPVKLGLLAPVVARYAPSAPPAQHR